MAGNSTKAVLTAVTANFFVCIAKFIGFALTGSGALLAEAIHSVADTANQALLYLGIKRSEKPADAMHPYGYGKARFFWGLVSALGIFFLGAGVTLMHGIQGLMHLGEHGVDHGIISWIVIAFAFVLEGWALWVVVKGIRHDAEVSGITFKKYVKEGRDPTAIAVLMEDTAAIFGLVIAAVSILLTQTTHWAGWDPMASIFIAGLLAYVAIFLIGKNRVFLLTRSVDAEVSDQVRSIIKADPVVDGIHKFKGVVQSMDRFTFMAEVDFDGKIVGKRTVTPEDVETVAKLSEEPEIREFLGDFAERVIDQLGDEVDRIEAKIRETVPRAADLDLEAD